MTARLVSPCAAAIFDLGDTLLEYAGLPLSWETHYPEALVRLAEHLGVELLPARRESGCAVLRRYNTRLTPRQHEVTFAEILGAIAAAWGAPATEADEVRSAGVFFSVFQQRLRGFPDANPALHDLRRRGLRVGVFTDVPYGMPRELVLTDVAQAGVAGFDLLLTSRDAGVRKPSPRALGSVATALAVAPEEVAYIGNERKDVEAALAFGCTAILLCRNGPAPAWGQHHTISSLAEL